MNINNLVTMKNFSGSFYIGIDSGGTKCEILVTDIKRKIIFNKTYKGIHYSIAGADIYTGYVSELIESSLHKAGLDLDNCIAIGMGVAGAREDKDRIILRKFVEIKLNYKNILITTDAMTALYGAFEGNEGIILISGTGSVLYGFTGGKITRVGGWGRIIGDEGSGYWIGRRALNLVTKEYDERKTESNLAKIFKEKFGITKRNINAKVFHENFDIQNIAPSVISLAKKNCILSRQIVNEAIDGLLWHIKTFLKVSRRKENIKIAFIGSIIENKNMVSDTLKKEIEELEIIEVTPKKYSPAMGAVLLAMENAGMPLKI